MVQFNLLPDVKLQFIKARRLKRMMTLVSIVVIIISLVVFTLMILTVNVFQRKSLSDLNKDIKTNSAELKSTKDLDKILTVQNQLSTLTTLHSQKVVGSRLFGYLAQITPKDASISKINVDFTAGGSALAAAGSVAAGESITITGEAPGLDVINTYTDTLKATTFNGGTVKNAHAFNHVVLTAFGRDSIKATYTITANFSPEIFDNSKTITLTVPAGPTVDPAALFQKQAGGV